MDGDPQASNTDFLQDLDLWLMQGDSASPTMNRNSLDLSAATASISSLEAALLTPTAPVTDTDAERSFVAALTDSTLPWTALSEAPALTNGSVPLSSPVHEARTPQEAAKATQTKVTRTRKGRASAASKTTEPTSLEPPKKKGKTNKSTSQRQKEELAYLREKSQELELQLTSLRQKSREKLESQQREEEQEGAEETSIVTRSLDEYGAPQQPEVSLWERIAKRQREEKAKAEVENVKLRDMVQSQMRLVKSFERLLRKRKIWDQLQENNRWQAEETRKDEEVLEDMLREVDSRYPQVDSVLNEHGLGETDPAVDVGDDANMKYSQTDGMYLEYKEKKYMPFDYKVLDEVVWRSFGEGKLKLEDSQLTILKSSDDIFYSRAILPLSRISSSNESKDVGNSVSLALMKRFPEENRVVHVWLANSSVKRPDDTTSSPVLLVQKGYAVIEPATLPDGSAGCTIRSYTISVPALAGKSSEKGEQTAQHREVGVLTELVFAAYQQSRQSISQTLENLVLDEMMAKNAATPATSTTGTDVSL